MDVRRAVHDGILELYLKALECDGWGDVDAAEDTYRRLNVRVKREVERGDVRLSHHELQQCARLTAMLALRVKELRTDEDMGIGAEACREIRPFVEAFLLDVRAEFPFDVEPEAVGEAPVALQMEALAVSPRRQHARGVDDRAHREDTFGFNSPPKQKQHPRGDRYGYGYGNYRDDDDDAEGGGRVDRRSPPARLAPAGTYDVRGGGAAGGVTARETGSLMPPPRLRNRGDMALTVKIDRFGFKGREAFIDPHATLSVVNSIGTLVEASQDTPIARDREETSEGTYVVFDRSVHVQTPVSELEEDVAIFLEFKHYKPKKKKTSTKAWCFFTLSELDPSLDQQRIAMEIYAKPTDLSRRRMGLLSVKKLYAHVECLLRTE